MTCAAEPPAGLHSPGASSSPSTAGGEVRYPVHRGRSVSLHNTHNTTLTPTLPPDTPMNLACFLAPANLRRSIKCAFVCARTHAQIPPRSISLRMETKHAPRVHQSVMPLPPQPSNRHHEQGITAFAPATWAAAL